jgi:hypothetical protein
MLTQEYIDFKYQDWLRRLGPYMAKALRDQLQVKLEQEQVEKELKDDDTSET